MKCCAQFEVSRQPITSRGEGVYDDNNGGDWDLLAHSSPSTPAAVPRDARAPGAAAGCCVVGVFEVVTPRIPPHCARASPVSRHREAADGSDGPEHTVDGEWQPLRIRDGRPYLRREERAHEEKHHGHCAERRWL